MFQLGKRSLCRRLPVETLSKHVRSQLDGGPLGRGSRSTTTSLVSLHPSSSKSMMNSGGYRTSSITELSCTAHRSMSKHPSFVSKQGVSARVPSSTSTSTSFAHRPTPLSFGVRRNEKSLSKSFVQTSCFSSSTLTTTSSPPDGSAGSSVVADQLSTESLEALATIPADEIPWYSVPTDWAADALLALHASSGLPWWGTLLVVALGMRAFLFPATIPAQVNAHKLQKLKPQMDKLKEKYQKLREKMSAVEASAQYQSQVKELNQKHNIKMRYSFLPFLQAPIMIYTFLGLRKLVETNPGGTFSDGGMLWFTDMAAQDPLWRLPLLVGATFLASMELNPDMKTKPAMKYVFRGLGLAFIPITAQFPSGIAFYWLCVNTASAGQGIVMRQPALRKMFGLPDRDGNDFEQATPATLLDHRPTLKRAAEASQLKAKKKAESGSGEKSWDEWKSDEYPKWKNKVDSHRNDKQRKKKGQKGKRGNKW
eukprot:TRINITY_DN2126_c0_g1_i2.p1 TRINITY_DN2126_c0_g1~~TRINITY_DN2126_c0_g1_i2.p1  ORF type:complete len:481 (+),score=89.55 TRINITY_DN2126_c0_g1_i2:116-1558(+)